MVMRLLTLFFIVITVVRVQALIELEQDGGIDFYLASSFYDDMVLQREPHRPVVWGYGVVGAAVTVSIEQDAHSTVVTQGPNGEGIWKVTLNSRPAGGPYRLQAVQNNGGLLSWILLDNILFGDVWVCSGQSNMQFTLPMAFNATEELALASNYSDIRVMTVAEVMSDVPLDDFKSIEQPWSIASSETLKGPAAWTYFSAVCWLYGRYLYDKLKIPIGLVASDWGGTPVEAWSSPKVLEECGLDQIDTSQRPQRQVNLTIGPNDNSVLWNAMIHPLLNMTIKGAIWYQGEANSFYHKDQYSCSFPAMIKNWRESWFEGTGGQTHSQFPFGFVQLSSQVAVDDGGFSLIRWHQTADYGYVPNSKMPNTFMAVAMDLGDPDSPYGSIHPRDKQDVASRLVLGALNVAYGQHVMYQGPVPYSAVRSSDGRVLLTYPNYQNLRVSENGNFAVCCTSTTCDYTKPSPSSNWIWAPITSHTHRTITLDVKACSAFGGQAEMIRYAWALSPCEFKRCSVYNDIGLPAPPYVIMVMDM